MRRFLLELAPPPVRNVADAGASEGLQGRPRAGPAALVAVNHGRRMMTHDTPAEHRHEDAMTHREFIALTDDELRRRIESPAGDDTVRHYDIDDYRDELRRRESAQQNARLDRLTVCMVVLLVLLFAIEVSRLIIDFAD